MSEWTQAEAIDLCRKVEAVCPQFQCHVALTGGLLYKDGPRKDCDLLFYRVRQAPCIDITGLLNALHDIGLSVWKDCGFCKKADYGNLPVDLFFPEEPSGEYDEEMDATDRVTTDDLLESWYRSDESEKALEEANHLH